MYSCAHKSETGFPKIRTTSSPRGPTELRRKLTPCVASYPNLPPCFPFVSSLAQNPWRCLHTPLRPPGPLRPHFLLHLFWQSLVQRRGTVSCFFAGAPLMLARAYFKDRTGREKGDWGPWLCNPTLQSKCVIEQEEEGCLPMMTTPNPRPLPPSCSSFNLM